MTPALPTLEQLRAPGSLAERWEVLIAAETPGSRPRAQACALALCWPDFRRQHPYSYQPLRYGGEVLDRLLAAGHKLRDVLSLGEAALVVCGRGLVSVEGAADFGEPPVDPAGGAPGT